MQIKQAQYFLAVTKAGSFSVAADELYISQSSLSKQIIALEKELDLILFDRSKRKVALTEAGKIFHKHALHLSKIQTALLADLGEYKKLIPALSIAAIPVIAQYGIAADIARFKAAYPNIALNLDEREAATVLPALNKREYDLALVRDYGVDLNHYSALEIVRDKLMVAVSKAHRLADRKSLSLAELADENFIMFNKGTLLYDLAVNACRAAGFEPRVFYATLRGASIIGLVAANSGVALMMEKVLDYYHRADVVVIPLATPVESKIIIAYPKKRKLSKSAKLFIEFMKK